MKDKTIPTASAVTGTAGRYQKCNAAAASNAVRPQVGTQPHLWQTPVRFASTGL